MIKSTFPVNPFIALFFLVCSLLNCSPSEVDYSAQIQEDYILIDQDSSNYFNGYLHGSLLKPIIKEQVKTWQNQMSMDLGLSLDDMEEIVYKKTNFLAAIGKYAPQLLEEINGIADGAELDRKLLLYYNLGEEIYNYQNKPTERCSNLAVENKDKNILVYNQDLPFFLHGINKPIILKSKEALVFTLPGLLALSGVSKNVAVSCNSLPMLKMNTKGLPLPFAIRQLLTQPSLGASIDYLQNTPLAIPQNFLLAASEGIIGFEVSQNAVKSYQAEDSTYLYHTNFPVYNRDYEYEAYKAPACARYQAIDSFIKQTDNLESYNEKTLTQIFGEKPLNNAETYLRFSASFPVGQNTKPSIQFINPRKSNTITILSI